MTVASTPRFAGPFAGNASATSFAFTFKVFVDTDVAVYFTGTDGVQTLLSANYSVALNADQNTSPGGTITYPSDGSPLAIGESLVVYSAMPFEQGTSLVNVGRYQPADAENALDYGTILSQQNKERLDRSMLAPLGETIDTALPAADDRALKVLGFDSSGQPTVYDPSATITDAAGVPVTTGTVDVPLPDVLDRHIAMFGGSPLVNDNLAAFTAALANAPGRMVRLSAGNYRIPVTAATALSIPAGGIEFEGEGMANTTITFVPTGSAAYAFGVVNNLRLKNLKMTVDMSGAGGGFALFHPSAGAGVKAEHCDFDGTCTDDGVSISHDAYMVYLPTSGTTNGQEFERCDIHAFKYALIKDNGSTSTDKRISFAHCDFYENYFEDLSGNSPNGVMDDVQVYMSRFRDGKGHNIGHNQLYCAFATVTNGHVSSNTFEGTLLGGQAVHIEEACVGVTVSANTINVDGHGIMLNGNDVGGAETQPRDIVISGNTVIKAGTQQEAGSYGIELVQDVDSDLPAKSVKIYGNTVVGYAQGFHSTTTLDDDCEIYNNTADSCLIGFDMRDTGMSVWGNTSRNCSTGVQAAAAAETTDAAVYQDHTFIGCTTNADATEKPVVLLDPKFVFAEFDHAGGATSVYKYLTSMGANDRVHGFLEMTAFHNGSSVQSSLVRDEATWDGSSFTRTNKIVFNSGNIQCAAANNSSQLAVQVFGNSGGATNVRLAARLNGMVVVAV